MVAVIGGADNGSFFVPSGCSHFGALLLDFYFTENTGGFHAKKEWKALHSSLSTLKSSLCEISQPSTSQHVPW